VTHAAPTPAARAVDLFAGAGGLSTGLAQAGVKVVAAANHWPRAVETHKTNHPDTQHFCQDVALMDPRDLPVHDLLAAAPACQGHSRARGKDKPHHDAMRSTAWCVVNVAEVTRPRLLVVENVPEMLRWALYPTWKQALRVLGYVLAENILNAAEFGVPQERRRLIITGVRAGKRTPAAPFIRSPRLAPVPASRIVDLAAGEWSPVAGHAASTLAKVAAARRVHGQRFLVPYYSGTKGGRSLDRPLGTVTTVDRYAVVDGDRMRMLSAREYQAAQGFPATYRITGSHAEQVAQLGNAVPPPLAAEVARQLLEVA